MARRLIWEEPEDMLKDILDYYKECDVNSIPYTMEGLADVLNVDVKTLRNYEKRDKFFPIIKKARIKINRRQTELALMNKTNSVYTMFLQKNNRPDEYKDKTEQEISGDLSLKEAIAKRK
jgi:hypothetical protein